MGPLTFLDIYRYVDLALPGLKENFGIDPRTFALDVLDISTEQALRTSRDDLPNELKDRLDHAIRRFKNGEPLQYITGIAYFDGHRFKVDHRVLIPRHDSEFLVEAVFEEIKHRTATNPDKQQALNVLEIGAGSGALTISLMYRCLDIVKFQATDISGDAIEVARENLIMHFKDRADEADRMFDKADLVGGAAKESQDILFSNPPYVGTDDEVDVHVLKEPAIALYSSEAGTAFYRRIFQEALVVIKKGGSIFLEVGAGQDKVVTEMGQKAGLTLMKSCKDLAENVRVLHFKKGPQ